MEKKLKPIAAGTDFQKPNLVKPFLKSDFTPKKRTQQKPKQKPKHMKTKQKYKETYFRQRDDILTNQEQEDGYIKIVLCPQFEGKKREWEISITKDGWTGYEEYRTTLKRAEAYAKKLAKAKGIKRIVVFAGARLINLE